MDINSDPPRDEMAYEQSQHSEPPPLGERFHRVSPWKFLILAVATLGFYELYWSYKCWRSIQKTRRPDIWPIARAFFAPLFFYSLAQEIEKDLGVFRAFRSGCLALLYFALTAMYGLPDPYWLIIYVTPLIMLPLVVDVDRLNRQRGPKERHYNRFGFGHVAATLLGGAVVVFSVLSVFGPIPSTQVVEGSEVPSHVVTFLRDKELFSEDESILYYYSGGFLSYLDDGNYFTENRVVSYWTEDGEFYAEEANYGSIANIETYFSESLLEVSEVYITRDDGTEFFLFVSAEAERDHLFIDNLLTRWAASR